MAQNYFEVGTFVPQVSAPAQCHAPLPQLATGQLQMQFVMAEKTQINTFPDICTQSHNFHEQLAQRLKQQDMLRNQRDQLWLQQNPEKVAQMRLQQQLKEQEEKLQRQEKAAAAAAVNEAYCANLWPKLLQRGRTEDGRKLLADAGISRKMWKSKRQELYAALSSNAKYTWTVKCNRFRQELKLWFNSILTKRYNTVFTQRADQMSSHNRRCLMAAIESAVNGSVDPDYDEPLFDAEFATKFVASGQTLRTFLRGYDATTADTISIYWCKSNPLHTFYTDL